MLFVAVGLAAVVIGRRYPFGTTASMGPGYFPAVLGGLLVALGAVAAGRSLRRGFHMLECPPAPLLLGSILGPMMEENLRRALLISGGDASVFVSRPISAGLLLAAAILVVLLTLPVLRTKREEAFQEEA